MVKTFQQLKRAIRENEHKIMVIGRQASEILDAINRAVFYEGRIPLYPFLSKLHKKFDMLEVIETNQKVAGILHRKMRLPVSRYAKILSHADSATQINKRR